MSERAPTRGLQQALASDSLGRQVWRPASPSFPIASDILAQRSFSNRIGDPWRFLSLKDIIDQRRQVIIFEDFIYGIPAGWSQSVGGTGGVYMTDSANAPNQTAMKPGRLRIDGNSGISGYAHSYSNPSSILLGANWEIAILAQMGGITLTSAVARLGWGDATANADVTDGAYFEYDQAVSANWYRCTASNGTRTKASTGIAFVSEADTWFRIRWNSATSVEFFINDVSGGSNTANLPTASGRDTGIHFFCRNGVSNGYSNLNVCCFVLCCPVKR